MVLHNMAYQNVGSACIIGDVLNFDGIPLITCKTITIFVIAALFYYPVLGFGLYHFILYQKKIRKGEVRKIVLDDEGAPL